MRRIVQGLSDAAVTLGALMLLFAVYLLWWTNNAAQAQAHEEVRRLEQEWRRPGGVDGSGGGAAPSAPGNGAGAVADGAASDEVSHADDTRGLPDGRRTPARSQTFGVLRIPAIGLTAPVAEGTDKHRVLDRGFVGHYVGTALPGQQGNVALAAHRNTHGEPFRHLDDVRPGDMVTLSTANGDFQYRIESALPSTSPDDGAVIQPVPSSAASRQAGYDKPGHYLTLTTCTPEFSSRYRLVVWGRLLEGGRG
ncbi:class E sortase [Streptomyces sp. NPDC052023]|uniref:class E sortase n=1 Tax=Streptomyces sp. NPDC052023 TaxID=3365681 RepID=UPI0037D2FD25